jgi:hypothetical protein
MKDTVSQFSLLLEDSKPSGSVFSPWSDVDEDNDVGPEASKIRRRHLVSGIRPRAVPTSSGVS